MQKISIIVPVYNVERYLPQCIESILIQSYNNWELILVDDGSPDGSGVICDQYAAADPRVRVFHKPNGGVSSARNLGIEKANGEWITFIDADDFISCTFLEGLLKPTFYNKSLDFIHGGCTNYCNDKPKGINQYYNNYIGDDPIILINDLRGLAFSKLFRLRNIKQSGISFDERMKIAEDMAFTLDYITTVNTYAFVSETGYYYRIDNMSSATKTCRKFDYTLELHSLKHISCAISKYLDLHNIPRCKVNKRYSQITLYIVNLLRGISSDSMATSIKIDKINMIYNGYHGYLDMSYLSNRAKLEIYLFKYKFIYTLIFFEKLLAYLKIL